MVNPMVFNCEVSKITIRKGLKPFGDTMHTLILGLLFACGEQADKGAAAVPGALPQSGAVIATVNNATIHKAS